jgi:CRP/FNR family transcriptional regulator
MTARSLADYVSHGEKIHAADGACLFRPGDEGRAFLIVTQGSVRVEQTNAAGRTVVLYRVEAGDSCVLTTTSLLSERPYSGYGYAEGEVSAAAVPPARFRALMSNEPEFRDLIFRSFAERVGELTDVIDELLLHRTDIRLARWLARQPGTTVSKTQQEIAQELGTVREVVSRSLKLFERRGWIALGRGSVSLSDRAALMTYGDAQEM